MKHRHSFFINPSERPPPDSFALVYPKTEKNWFVRVYGLKAAREWKITVNIEDLNDDNRRELRKGRMTIQFVKDTAKFIPEPLQRSFVTGVQVLWNGPSEVSDLPFIGSMLPLSSPEPIHLPRNLSYIHFDTLPPKIMNRLFKVLDSLLIPGTVQALLEDLPQADVIDFDILSSKTIQIRAIWASATANDGWKLNIFSDPNNRIEVAFFDEGTGEDKDEHALNGVRAILGVDEEFQPTLFTFPHRHHILQPHSLQTTLSPAYGSHPVLRTILSGVALQPPINDTLNHESCKLHALYTLSKNVFVDKYQLTQLAQFQSGGIQNLRGVWGETDLENPSYKTQGWGSVVLIDIPTPEKTMSEMSVELPLHLRYLEPQAGGGMTRVSILPPEVFWACENTIEDFSVSPFGPPTKSVLHTLFPSDTVFYHLPNHTTYNEYSEGSHGNGVVSLNVPVADASQAQLVQNLTILGILTGFAYLFVKGVRVGIKGFRWRGKGKEKAKDL